MIFRRKYDTALTTGTYIEIPMIKLADTAFAATGDWTPASGDVTIKKDNGSASNIGTLPTAQAAGNGYVWRFTLSAAELQAKQVLVTIVDATSGKAVEDNAFIVETFGNASAMYPHDDTADLYPANVTQVNGSSTVATKFEKAVSTITQGTCTTGSSTTSIVTSDLSNTVSNDHYKDKWCVFVTGAYAGQAKQITAYTASTRTLTINALQGGAGPASSDTLVIV